MGRSHRIVLAALTIGSLLQAQSGPLPGRAVLREQITALLSKQAENFFGLSRRGGKLFALHFQPPKEQPFLIEIDSPDHLDPGRVVLDPVQMDPSGRTTIDFYIPSRDGR